MFEQYSIDLWEWLVWYWYAIPVGLAIGFGLIGLTIVLCFKLLNKGESKER